MSESDVIRSLVDPPPEVLGASVEELLARMGGPFSVRVSGRRRPSSCRLVMTLLHGNEPSGAEAIHRWLCEGSRPAVDAVFVIAAVETALREPRFSHRMLPGTRDLNRCFAGPFDDAPGRLAAAILEEIARLRPECVVDVHNNTGHNPPYAIGMETDRNSLALAAIFAHRFIHSELRIGSLMEAVTEVPCVTVECGRAGDPLAVDAAYRGIDRLMQVEEIGSADVPAENMEILASMVRVRASEGVRLTMSDARNPDVDLTITHDIDRHNFERIADGTVLGWVEAAAGWPLEAIDDRGADRSHELFAVDAEGRLRARGSWIPIMMTTDPVIAAQDCLFYVVERQ